VYDQRVYYNFPMSAEAQQAATDLAALRTQLEDKYPPAMPHAMLDRAQKLLDGGQPARARTEFTALIPQLGGAERELAQVLIGVTQFNSKDNAGAYKYLSSLEVSAPEADAERLFYLAESARRLERLDDMVQITNRLGASYPASPWRLKALV